MTNKEAIDGIDVIMTDYPLTRKENEALELAIQALEEAQLDIKLLKMDLPELFRPSYDGGYLKGAEE